MAVNRVFGGEICRRRERQRISNRRISNQAGHGCGARSRQRKGCRVDRRRVHRSAECGADDLIERHARGPVERNCRSDRGRRDHGCRTGGEGPYIVLGQPGSRQIHCSGGNGRRVDRARQQVRDRLEYRYRTSRDIGDHSRYAHAARTAQREGRRVDRGWNHCHAESGGESLIDRHTYRSVGGHGRDDRWRNDWGSRSRSEGPHEIGRQRSARRALGPCGYGCGIDSVDCKVGGWRKCRSRARATDGAGHGCGAGASEGKGSRGRGKRRAVHRFAKGRAERLGDWNARGPIRGDRGCNRRRRWRRGNRRKAPRITVGQISAVHSFSQGCYRGRVNAAECQSGCWSKRGSYAAVSNGSRYGRSAGPGDLKGCSGKRGRIHRRAEGCADGRGNGDACGAIGRNGGHHSRSSCHLFAAPGHEGDH